MKYTTQFITALIIMSVIVLLAVLGGIGQQWAATLSWIVLPVWLALNLIVLCWRCLDIDRARRGTLDGKRLADFNKRAEYFNGRPSGLTTIIRAAWMSAYVIIVAFGWAWLGGLLMLAYVLNVVCLWVAVDLADKMAAKSEAMG